MIHLEEQLGRLADLLAFEQSRHQQGGANAA